MAITKFQQDCKEALKAVVNEEGLDRNDVFSAALQAAIDLFAGNGRKEHIEDIESVVHLAAAMVGSFNASHLSRGSFQKGDKIKVDAAIMSTVSQISTLVCDAFLNAAYSAIFDQENVPTSPAFFSTVLEPLAKLAGAKVSSRLGVASISDEEREQVCNQFVTGCGLVTAHSAATLMVVQHNVAASNFGKPKLDDETKDSIVSEFEQAVCDGVRPVSHKWNAYFKAKITSYLDAAKASSSNSPSARGAE